MIENNNENMKNNNDLLSSSGSFYKSSSSGSFYKSSSSDLIGGSCRDRAEQLKDYPVKPDKDGLLNKSRMTKSTNTTERTFSGHSRLSPTSYSLFSNSNIRSPAATSAALPRGVSLPYAKKQFTGLFFLARYSRPDRESLCVPASSHNSESGKSMVEMLGVLALMGLLSILGVKGYDMAMERATANRILEEVNRRSVVYSQQLLMMTSNVALNHSELASELEGGFPISADRFGDDYFQITLQKAPKNICERIGKMGYQRAIQVASNGKEMTTTDQSGCQTTGNVLSFTFTKDLTPCAGCLSGIKTCETNGQCATNQTCQNGMCQCAPQYECNGKCCATRQFCVNGACTATPACQTSDDCEQGFCSAGQCRCTSYQDCNYFCMMSEKNIGICSNAAYAEEGSGSRSGTIWSTMTLNWYVAKDFCESNGKQMVSLSDLGCVANGDTYTCTVPEKFKLHSSVWVSDQWKDSTHPWAVNTTNGTGGSTLWANDGSGGGYYHIALCH